jgi:hypothetical protein
LVPLVVSAGSAPSTLTAVIVSAGGVAMPQKTDFYGVVYAASVNLT